MLDQKGPAELLYGYAQVLEVLSWLVVLPEAGAAFCWRLRAWSGAPSLLSLPLHAGRPLPGTVR